MFRSELTLEDPEHRLRSIRLAYVDWPDERSPADLEARRALEALAGDRSLDLTRMADGDLLVAGTVNVNLELVRSGWVRSAPGSPPDFEAAEAGARASKVGGWSPAYRETLRRWLRASAVRPNGWEPGRDGDDMDLESAIRLNWNAARMVSREALADFEWVFDDAPATTGPPTCAHRLGRALLSSQRTKRVSAKGIFESPVLVQIPQGGRAFCEAWANDGHGQRLKREELDGDSPLTRTLVYELSEDGRSVSFTFHESRSASGLHGGIGPQALPVRGVGPDVVVLGYRPWFTSLEACEEALTTQFPNGCDDLDL